MRASLLRELHVDPNTTDADSHVTNDVNLAIIESIRFNRRYRFWFNTRHYVFQTTSNQDRYAMPTDFLGLIQDSVYSVPGYDFLSKRRLKSVPLQWAEQNQQSIIPSAAYREIGSPHAFSIDMGTKEMIIIPIPSDNGDHIEIHYVADIGTPVAKFASGAWAFYAPPETGVQTTAAETLPNTFTNAWFQEAYELTLTRAAYYLFSRTYGGVQGAAEKANQYITQWMEQLNALRSSTRLLSSATEIRKHI